MGVVIKKCIMSVEVVTKEDWEKLSKGIFIELNRLQEGQEQILTCLDKMKSPKSAISPEYIPALDFMKAVGIKRWKFDQLIAGNLIKTIKKKRKIYVAVREVERYFTDPSIL